LSLPGTTPATSVGHIHFCSMQSPIGSQRFDLLRDSPVHINDDMKAASPVDMGSDTAVGVTAAMSAAARVGLGIDAPSEVSFFMNMCT
jgi:hypothetical protein